MSTRIVPPDLDETNPQSEFVWVVDCHMCGKQHSMTEPARSEDLVKLMDQSSAFERRCERWFQTHLERMEIQRQRGSNAA